MKITLQNLGVIKEAEIDQKPLTIFVGPNNSGKTWTAYAITSILGPWGFTNYSKAYLKGDIQENYPPLEDFIEQVTKTGTGTFDLAQFVNDYAEIYFNNVAHCIPTSIAQFMNTELASFENINISIDLAEEKPKMLKQILNLSIRGGTSGEREKAELTFRKTRGNKDFIAYTSSQDLSLDESLSSDESDENSLEQFPPEILKDLLTRTVLRTLHRSLYPFIYVLPTERTTIIVPPYQIRKVKAEEMALLEQDVQQRKFRPLSGPIGYLLSMMEKTYETEVSKKMNRNRDAKNNPKIREYIFLAKLLEEIIGGKVSYSHPTLSATSDRSSVPDITFQPTEESKLEIAVASSMVKELLPLVFYLRYLAEPNELLIIDEPEMNLHPEAQVKIIEFLALLVNAGLHVLITTHSPYIVDHLANLIKANEVQDKEDIRDQFFLKRTDAFISKDKVMVYLFEQGQAKKVIDEEGVIELNSFGHVCNRISDIYFNL